MPPYLLSKHAHLCVGADRVVILDLARENYLALPMAEARSLSGWVQNWPIAGARSAEPETLKQLLTEGLLTADGARGRSESLLAKAIEPSQSLEDRMDVEVRIQLSDVYRFLVAICMGAFALRCVPLRHLVAYVRRRKTRAADFDIERVPMLLAKYDYLYAWLMDRRDECLRNSLFLLIFLSQYGLVPDWVFGVRPTPFLAHCWLQHREVVINDKVRSTACLTPMLIV